MAVSLWLLSVEFDCLLCSFSFSFSFFFFFFSPISPDDYLMTVRVCMV